jgi:hypothetical protein
MQQPGYLNVLAVLHPELQVGCLRSVAPGCVLLLLQCAAADAAPACFNPVHWRLAQVEQIMALAGMEAWLEDRDELPVQLGLGSRAERQQRRQQRQQEQQQQQQLLQKEGGKDVQDVGEGVGNGSDTRAAADQGGAQQVAGLGLSTTARPTGRAAAQGCACAVQ